MIMCHLVLDVLFNLSQIQPRDTNEAQRLLVLFIMAENQTKPIGPLAAPLTNQITDSEGSIIYSPNRSQIIFARTHKAIR
jgi:hypothetical protein